MMNDEDVAEIKKCKNIDSRKSSGWTDVPYSQEYQENGTLVIGGRKRVNGVVHLGRTKTFFDVMRHEICFTSQKASNSRRHETPYERCLKQTKEDVRQKRSAAKKGLHFH